MSDLFSNALEIFVPRRNNTSCRIGCWASGYKQIISPNTIIDSEIPDGDNATSFSFDGSEIRYTDPISGSRNNIVTVPDSENGYYTKYTIPAGIHRNDYFDQSLKVAIYYTEDPFDQYSQRSVEIFYLTFNRTNQVHGSDIQQLVTVSSPYFGWMIEKIILQDDSSSTKTYAIDTTEINDEAVGTVRFNFNHETTNIIQLFLRGRLDYAMNRIQNRPADTQITRDLCHFNIKDYPSYAHLDIGGEGYHQESIEDLAGFENSINVNTLATQSGTNVKIPNLVQIENWNNPLPFEAQFADYITMQNTPFSQQSVNEIARCIRPTGHIGLWIDSDQYADLITQLVTKVNGTKYTGNDANDEFKGLAGYPKILINAGTAAPH